MGAHVSNIKIYFSPLASPRKFFLQNMKSLILMARKRLWISEVVLTNWQTTCTISKAATPIPQKWYPIKPWSLEILILRQFDVGSVDYSFAMACIGKQSVCLVKPFGKHFFYDCLLNLSIKLFSVIVIFSSALIYWYIINLNVIHLWR